MAFKVIISEEAKFDLEEQYLYYREFANKKIADDFFISFDRIRKTISKNPFFKIWLNDIHGVPLKKYPFVVFL